MHLTSISLKSLILFISLILFFIPSQVFPEEESEGWKQFSDMPEQRTSSASVSVNGKIYVFGGLNNSEQATDTIFVYNSKNDKWESASPMPKSLHHLGAAIYDGKIFVVGGGISTGASYSKLNHGYTNTSIPEFGLIIPLVMVASFGFLIFILRLKMNLQPGFR